MSLRRVSSGSRSRDVTVTRTSPTFLSVSPPRGFEFGVIAPAAGGGARRFSAATPSAGSALLTADVHRAARTPVREEIRASVRTLLAHSQTGFHLKRSNFHRRFSHRHGGHEAQGVAGGCTPLRLRRWTRAQSPPRWWRRRRGPRRRCRAGGESRTPPRTCPREK